MRFPRKCTTREERWNVRTAPEHSTSDLFSRTWRPATLRMGLMLIRLSKRRKRLNDRWGLCATSVGESTSQSRFRFILRSVRKNGYRMRARNLKLKEDHFLRNPRSSMIWFLLVGRGTGMSIMTRPLRSITRRLWWNVTDVEGHSFLTL